MNTTCAGCRSLMDPSTATYDKQGNLLCRSCAARSTIAEGDTRAVGSLVSSAIAVPILGVLSWTCFNPFAITSVLGVIAGIGWLLAIARAGAYRDRMGNKFVPCLVGVILGLLMALASLGLNALALLGVAMR